MAGDLIRFVDSIAASPTVRLNLNDESAWYCSSFDAPPPRLRRSMSVNALADGGYVSAAQYEPRIVTLTLELKTATQDANATELQKIGRELDRTTNLLMYQPTGATKPVFFRTFRSDITGVADVTAQAAFRILTVELLAEPFALGLKETLGPYTVNNDPAAATNGNHVDITGVLGDVATPVILSNTTAFRSGTVMGVRQGTPLGPVFTQAEGGGTVTVTRLDADTTLPALGTDAAMSGTAAPNFVRTSFATLPGMTARLSLENFTTSGQFGRFVVYGVFRAAGSPNSNFKMGISPWSGLSPSETVMVTPDTSRQLLRLGVWENSGNLPNPGGRIPSADRIYVWAERLNGTSQLDWDYFLFVPADSASLTAYGSVLTITSSTHDQVYDGYAGVTVRIPNGADPTAYPAPQDAHANVAGGYPQLAPSVTNRLVWTVMSPIAPEIRTVDVDTLTVNYWPRYLYVRPSAS